MWQLCCCNFIAFKIVFHVKDNCITRTISAAIDRTPGDHWIHPCMMGGDSTCLEKKFNEDTGKVNIWYDNGYGGIEEHWEVLRIDTTMLFNSIGGAMGLFLGFSLNSLLAMLFEGITLESEKNTQVTNT